MVNNVNDKVVFPEPIFRDSTIINGGIHEPDPVVTLESRERPDVSVRVPDGYTRGSGNQSDLDPDGAYRQGGGGRGTDIFGGDTPPDTIVPNPQGDVSPDDNLTNLYNQLLSLLTGQFGYNFGAFNGQNYLNIIRNVLASVNQIFDDLDLDDDYAAAQLSFLEKVANVAQSYIDNIFTTILQYQSWYLQQEYNSPLNQLKRLEAAGLNSAFIFGNYGNTASSPALSGGAGGAGFATSQMSGAGEVAQQEKSSKRSAWASMFGESLNATANLISAGIESTKVIAEANNIKLMTPLQMQESIGRIHNLGLAGEYLKDQAFQIESTEFNRWFNEDKELYKLQLSNAANERDAAQQALNDASSNDFALSMGSILVDEQVYTCHVVDKSGHIKEYDLSYDELQKASKNGMYIDHDTRILADHENDSGVNPFGIGVRDKRSQHENEGHGEGITKDSSQSYKNGYQGYNESGRTLRIGDTTFTLNTRHRRVDSEEYKKYMNGLKNRLLFATERFNSLSTGEIAATFSSLDNYIRNYSRGLSLMYQRGVRQQLRALIEPQAFTGD